MLVLLIWGLEHCSSLRSQRREINLRPSFRVTLAAFLPGGATLTLAEPDATRLR
jgi:hypothetical protein